jgi:hypothetical protein
VLALHVPLQTRTLPDSPQCPDLVGRGSDEPVKPHGMNGSRGRSPHRARQIRTLPNSAQA